MSNYQKFFLAMALTIGIFYNNPINAEIILDPVGFTVTLELNVETDLELAINNRNEEDIVFNIGCDLIKDEDNRQAGPRRDDPGDEIASIDAPFSATSGMAWDGECMWICSYGDHRVATYDPDEEEVIRNLQVNYSPLAMTFDGELIWVAAYSSATVYQYDLEGEQVGTVNMPHSPIYGMAYDMEQYVYLMSSQTIHVIDVEENERVTTFASAAGFDNQDVWSMCWVPEHRDGQLWGIYQGRMHQALVEIDDDEWSIENVQSFNIDAECQHNGIAHDGEYMWFGMWNENSWRIVDDGVEEFHMLTFTPEEGIIEGDDVQIVDILVQAGDAEAGVYNILIEIELSESEEERDDFEATVIQMSCIVSVESPAYYIEGTVMDETIDAAVEDVTVSLDRYIITRFTDDDGEYILEDLPPGEYDLTFTAEDYLPTTETVEIDEDDVELNVALLHSECTPSQDQFFMELEPDYSHEFEFQVDNGGNGPLTYTIDRRLLGEANAEPFELRRTNEIEDLTGDDMLAGVVFVDGNFYISGGNNGDNPNKIYVLNTDGEVVDELDQFVEDRYGMRDLAYDGELIWGAVEGTFYGFNTDGDLINSFSVDANVEGRALAWDPVDEVLLASDIFTDIFAINRNGDVVDTYRRPAELRIYGLGVWPDDPDDCYLYVFCRGPDNVGIDAFKVNPATGEHMLAQYFDVGDGRPGGIQITNQLDVYSWVIVSLVQNPDRLNVWQLAARKEWFQITPTAGVIEPDEYDEFVLSLNATGLPPGNDFRGEVVFMHDGVDAETVLDVTLSVVEGRIPTTRDLELHIGWNTISTNLQPDNNEDIEGLVADIVENGAMIMMKNTNGDFYRPAYDFNNIDAWNSWEGFQMLMAEAATLTIAGESVLKEDPIDLTEGWQLVSYYPRYEIEATEALASIYDHLIIAKDGSGNFCLPEWDDFSNMGNLCEGQGYFIKVDADCRLVYVPAEEERSAGDINSRTNIPVCHNTCQSVCHEDQIWLSETPRSSVSYSLLLLTEDMGAGTHLEAYTPSGALAGRGVVDGNGRCGMALWGNESGFSDGEAITITSAGSADIPPIGVEGKLVGELEWLDGDKSGWKADGWGVAKLTGSTEIPSEFGIVSAYPNPFNSQMRLSYNLLETGVVDLAAYDVSGRRVAELTSGRQVSGVHTVMFDGKDMPSGVYMLRLQAGGQSSMVKVMLVK